jgi:predicted ArsR family transcriptional regulator
LIVTDLPELNSTFHQPVRTRLAVLLSRSPRSFSQLKLELQITDGNLDAHLRKLSAAGYLHSQMVFDGRPRTVYGLSSSGANAFRKYVRNLFRLIETSAPAK